MLMSWGLRDCLSTSSMKARCNYARQAAEHKPTKMVKLKGKSCRWRMEAAEFSKFVFQALDVLLNLAQ